MTKGMVRGILFVDRLHVLVLCAFILIVGTHFLIVEFLSWFIFPTESLSSLVVAPLVFALKKTQSWLFGNDEWFKFVPFLFGVDLFLLLVKEMGHGSLLRSTTKKVENSFPESGIHSSLPVLQKKWSLEKSLSNSTNKIDLSKFVRGTRLKWKGLKKDSGIISYRARKNGFQVFALPALLVSWLGLIYLLTLDRTPLVQSVTTMEGNSIDLPFGGALTRVRFRCDPHTLRCRAKKESSRNTISSTSFYSKQIFKLDGGFWVLDRVLPKGWRVDLEVLQSDGTKVQTLRGVSPSAEWIELQGARFRVAKVERELEVPSSGTSIAFGDSLEIEYEQKDRTSVRRTIFQKFPKYDWTLHKKSDYYFLVNEIKPEVQLSIRVFDTQKSIGLLIALFFAIVGFLLMARGPRERYWLLLRGSTLWLVGWCADEPVLQMQANRIENSIQEALMANASGVQD